MCVSDSAKNHTPIMDGCSESNAGVATWGSVHLDGSSTDFVSEDIVGLSDTVHVLVSGLLLLLLLGLGTLTSSKLVLVASRLLLLLVLFGSTKDVVLGSRLLGLLVILTVVVSTKGEG